MKREMDIPLINDVCSIEQSMLKNGWTTNGASYYVKLGKIVIIYVTIRQGNIGKEGTELFNLPFTLRSAVFAYNGHNANGAILIDINGTVSILSEVVNPSNSNIVCTLIATLK